MGYMESLKFRVYEKKVLSAFEIFWMGDTILHEHSHMKSTFFTISFEVWKPPPLGYLKLSIDVSWNNDNQCASVRIVLS